MDYTFAFRTDEGDYPHVRTLLSKAGEPVISLNYDSQGVEYRVRTTVGQATLIETLLVGAAVFGWVSDLWYTYDRGSASTPRNTLVQGGKVRGF